MLDEREVREVREARETMEGHKARAGYDVEVGTGVAMFIAMNTFKIAPGKGEDFERIWTERETHLDQVPGFVRFALLRADAEGEYVSHSTWESREAFVAWTESEAFKQGHSGPSLMGILQGPPQVALYEAALTQEAGGPSRQE